MHDRPASPRSDIPETEIFEASTPGLGPGVPHEKIARQYTKCLKTLLDAFRSSDILAVEWGQGLSRRLGDDMCLSVSIDGNGLLESKG
jgi:hypothetical protein